MWEPALLDPLVILVARVIGTSLETIRTNYINRGHSNLATRIGVVKVAIWLFSTGLVFSNLRDVLGITAYVAGYAIGTVIGMRIEERISLGSVIVRVFHPGDPTPLRGEVRRNGFWHHAPRWKGVTARHPLPSSTWSFPARTSGNSSLPSALDTITSSTGWMT
ncbi:MAG: DUF5698 domain-containing protein [Methanolinea sp.]|nr:DUF5698 domain-containing protein [Methanolinea sp.]